MEKKYKNAKECPSRGLDQCNVHYISGLIQERVLTF